MNKNNPDMERRKYPRPPLNVEIYCEGERNPKVKESKRGTGVICLYSTDVSIGGIFLESTIPFTIGTIIYLRFQLPNTDRPICAMGKIIRQQFKDNYLEGMGVEFLRIGFAEKELLENYIKSVT